MPPVRDDPYSGFNFLVSIDGISDDPRAVRGSFSEVSGLDVEVAVIEYRNGSEDITVRKLPGLRKYSNIVLKRGITSDLRLWNWMESVLNGSVVRANGYVALLDESRAEVRRWNFRRGWPCKLSGPVLHANANEIAIETLEICHEGLSIESNG
jgi:phage tail-like protein